MNRRAESIDLSVLIMAGGTGTRFWPASRAATPKQLLPLVGNSTMIRQTARSPGVPLGSTIPPASRPSAVSKLMYTRGPCWT